MTQEEIQERNKQIIQMIGFKRGFWIHQEKPLTDDKRQWCDIDGKTILGTRVYYDKDLQFHSDWNWLMEAVEFVQRLPLDEKNHRIWNMQLRTPKIEIFIAVSDFAKLYNEGKL